MSVIRQGLESADLDVPVVLPTLNLDFANSQSLDRRITFTRGSTATRVNRNGLIETVGVNQPRFDFDPISGECKGLLIEESRTNYWRGTQTGGGSGTVSDGTATGADGVTAKKFVTTLGSAAFPGLSNYTQYSIPVGSQVTGGTVDISFSGYFAATGTGLYVPDIVIAIGASGSNYIFAELLPDLTNGNIVSKSLSAGLSEIIAPQITLMPFGMYKVTWSVRYTQGATIRNTVNFGIQCRRKNSPSGATGTYYADGVNGFQFSCIQYEIGAVPTSYIPTTASSVTRSVDNAEMTGINFSSWYNQSEGTFFYNGTLPFITNDTVTRVPFGVSNGFNFSNSMYVAKTPTTLGLSFTVINNNVSQTTGTSLPNMTSSKFKIASSVAPNNIYSCGYGGVVNKHSRPSAAIPTATRLTLGKEPWNGSALNPIIGCISKFAYYPKALSPAELQYLIQ